MRKKRLISVAHSYCVALNRRLLEEIERLPGSIWKTLAVAPKAFPADLGRLELNTDPNSEFDVRGVSVNFARKIHVMVYGRELYDLLRGGDFVHCSEEPYVFCGGQVAWWTSRKVPFVFNTAQNIIKRYPPPFRWIEKFCLDRCLGWTACGQSIVETRPAFYRNKPHRVMPIGVDTNLFQPNSAMRTATLQKLGWQSAGPAIVGFLGRFVEEKGVCLILECLESANLPWRVLFVGGGPLQSKLDRFALRFPDRVRVINGVSHDEVPGYLNAMDLLAAPSQTRRNWREQFGRMLIEAFACGVPVIASDSGEIPHVVGNAGMIVPENSLTGWRQAFDFLLTDADHRLALRNAGLERVHRKFAWPIIARQHANFFEELMCGVA